MEAKTAAIARITLRLTAMVCGGIVIGCISGGLYQNEDYAVQSGVVANKKTCYFDVDWISELELCELGIASGAISVGIAVIFMFIDFVADVHGTEPQTSKRFYAASVTVSIAMVIMWIFCFSYMVSGWVDVEDKHNSIVKNHIEDRAEVTLSFSFLSILVWIAVGVLSFLSLMQSKSS